MRVPWRTAAVLVVVSAASVVPGVAAKAAPAPPTVVSKARATALALPTPGLEVVQSIKLTAGSWTVMAKATAFGGEGNDDFFRCQLVDTTHTTVLDGSTSQLGFAIERDVVTNLAVVKVKVALTIAQECGHDGDTGDAGQIDPGASLVGFVTPPTRMRISRTVAQVPIGDSGSIGVANLSLPKGSWVLALKFSPVDLEASTAGVYCEYPGASTNFGRALGTTVARHGVSTVFFVDVTTVSTPTTLTLSCSGTDTHAYLDPNTVLWAWKATDLQATETRGSCPATLAGSATADALVVRQQGCSIDPGTFPSQMIGAQLRQGTWVAFAAVDALLSNGSANVDHCEVLDASHGKQLDVSTATEPVFANEASTGMTNLVVVTVKKKLATEGRCGQDKAGSPGVIYDSGWAFIRP